MKELIIKIDEGKRDIEGNVPLVGRPHELVRCKDCKYSTSNGAMTELLPYYLACKSVPRTEDYFCANGELKDSEIE